MSFNVENIVAHVQLTPAAQPRRPTDSTAGAVGCSRLLDRGAGRKVEAMKVAFELPPAQAERLREEAARLGVAPDELAKAAISDLLATQARDFEATARKVLDRNRELYRRLA